MGINQELIGRSENLMFVYLPKIEYLYIIDEKSNTIVLIRKNDQSLDISLYNDVYLHVACIDSSKKLEKQKQYIFQKLNLH